MRGHVYPVDFHRKSGSRKPNCGGSNRLRNYYPKKRIHPQYTANDFPPVRHVCVFSVLQVMLFGVKSISMLVVRVHPHIHTTHTHASAKMDYGEDQRTSKNKRTLIRFCRLPHHDVRAKVGWAIDCAGPSESQRVGGCAVGQFCGKGHYIYTHIGYNVIYNNILAYMNIAIS